MSSTPIFDTLRRETSGRDRIAASDGLPVWAALFLIGVAVFAVLAVLGVFQ
jgi:hypothetical protein